MGPRVHGTGCLGSKDPLRAFGESSHCNYGLHNDVMLSKQKVCCIVVGALHPTMNSTTVSCELVSKPARGVIMLSALMMTIAVESSPLRDDAHARLIGTAVNSSLQCIEGKTLGLESWPRVMEQLAVFP